MQSRAEKICCQLNIISQNTGTQILFEGYIIDNNRIFIEKQDNPTHSGGGKKEDH